MVIQQISCMARKNSVVVVIDIIEKKWIAADPQQQTHRGNWNRFNSQVAFDQDGTVLAVYRKEVMEPIFFAELI